MLEHHDVLRIWETARSSAQALVLDEAFIDYIPQASLAREAVARPGLIVLRALTKFYGCPALRIGYAIAHPETVRRIQSLLPTWGITQFAIDALTEAVADAVYAEASIEENANERARLSDSLAGLGLVVYPSAANYLLIELPPNTVATSELRMRMAANHRVLIRNCDSYEGLATGRYLRVAVRSFEDNRRLTQALAEELRMP
jgi:threonine-phosphate decarboxylase